MTKQFIAPNYSGVTIQITNPAVNVSSQPYPDGVVIRSGNYATCPQDCYSNNYYQNNPKEIESVHNLGRVDAQNIQNYNEQNKNYDNNTSDEKFADKEKYPLSYPAEYYLNDYNRSAVNKLKTDNNFTKEYEATTDLKQSETERNFSDSQKYEDKDDSRNSHVVYNYDPSAYKVYGNKNDETDTTTSKGIIEELSRREEEIEQEKRNSKETRVVALTDEYIKSLENYLNNPNDEIRLMASKEILTRLDEDKDRYDDAALNALLNKMLQDPSKLIRIAALSAFASQLACGNDYTVQLLNNIQSNPNADKEDVLQAADILLKMSAGTEVKNIPNPQNNENRN